jgi:hypothetical protein
MPKYIAATHSEGKNYRLKKLNEVLTEFTVDGKKVEPGMGEYADILDQFAMLEKTVVANDPFVQHNLPGNWKFNLKNYF